MKLPSLTPLIPLLTLHTALTHATNIIFFPQRQCNSGQTVGNLLRGGAAMGTTEDNKVHLEGLKKVGATYYPDAALAPGSEALGLKK
ncbi:hypothetical protein B0T16DRAFT_458815 [Cercophora newfieldiana]|uniref:Uncharacterized protein n=1 Tax=Cercophora newfieldiana TaxID=92897 RepID=A0AA39Y6N7_9PEZI|nr:hypothetical protein B0T16DRAFT_458815 [Cercophora newfieldiana]